MREKDETTAVKHPDELLVLILIPFPFGL
jgi:hypothetical protein